MKDESHILRSWALNAQNWIQTIDNEEIESRKLATNRAIVEAILQYRPRKVLDLGCGEGWLTRLLSREGIEAYGADGTAALIEDARRKGPGNYQVRTYEEIVAGEPLDGEPFDTIAINFGLFGKESTEALIGALKERLAPGGQAIIQTLHPFGLMEKGVPYAGHWESNSWDGLKGEYTEPHRWYFRTIGEWVSLFTSLGLAIRELREPLNPESRKPLSLLFVVG
ncbi:MAG: class I SAM-dependent methyltransferase [Lewinellaceae bacterium]|nr:class I SAM-dependent methyltransferase [Lewinellaceae bacterium]MCB9289584.1 class I SAM-dependent methyltransferase [Lewinellaceae bacterium]